MEAALKLTNVKNYFTVLEEEVGGTFSKVYGENVMTLNNENVEGSIKGVEIRKNKFFFEFDLNVKKEFSISIPPEGYNAINFLYCQKGALEQSFGNSKDSKTLKEFQTAIVAHKTNKTVLTFKAGTDIKLVMISVCNQVNYEPSIMTAKVHSLFTEKMVNDELSYFGTINLKISEQINNLHDINETGLVRKLMVEGSVQLILGMEIQHHKDDMANKKLFSASLTRREISVIQELGERIKANVSEQYCINMFMDETGISAAKLQEGFKLLYGRTVTDYIKNLRVEESERLIKTTDMNISQIVYTIGFSSRSYFSKIFRKKYDCSPNEYLNKSRNILK